MEAFVNTSQSIKHNGGGTFSVNPAQVAFSTASDEFAIMTASGNASCSIGSMSLAGNGLGASTVYVPPSTTVTGVSGTTTGSYVRFKNA